MTTYNLYANVYSDKIHKKLKTNTVALFPILIALNKFKDKGIEGFIGATEDQKYILGLMEEALKIHYSPEQIKSFISGSAAELNRILKDHGFDIQLDESMPIDLGVVTIMNLIGKWLVKAVETTVTNDGISYPAAFIKTGASIKTIHQYTDHEKQVLQILTTEGLVVYIEIADQERSGMELFKHIISLTEGMSLREIECNATIPMVSVDHQPDISWLTGMHASNTDLVISQALQQNKLTIDLDGIHAESAVALAAKRGMAFDRKHMVIDKPFNIWLEYGDDPYNKHFPLFAAYVAPDSWKKPNK